MTARKYGEGSRATGAGTYAYHDRTRVEHLGPRRPSPADLPRPPAANDTAPPGARQVPLTLQGLRASKPPAAVGASDQDDARRAEAAQLRGRTAQGLSPSVPPEVDPRPPAPQVQPTTPPPTRNRKETVQGLPPSVPPFPSGAANEPGPERSQAAAPRAQAPPLAEPGPAPLAAHDVTAPPEPAPPAASPPPVPTRALHEAEPIDDTHAHSDVPSAPPAESASPPDAPAPEPAAAPPPLPIRNDSGPPQAHFRDPRMEQLAPLVSQGDWEAVVRSLDAQEDALDPALRLIHAVAHREWEGASPADNTQLTQQAMAALSPMLGVPAESPIALLVAKRILRRNPRWTQKQPTPQLSLGILLGGLATGVLVGLAVTKLLF